MTRTPRRLLLVAAALVLVLAACGGDDDEETTATTAPPAGAVTTEPGASPDTTMAGDMEDHNDADIAFATGMIAHHRQAVAMADIVLEKGEDPDVIDLAQRIKDAQEPEIATMTGWLEMWGAPVPDDSMGGMDDGMDDGMGGDGMASAEEMAALEAAEPPELERLFMEDMIRHHEGAIAMAQTELAEGLFPDAKALAQDIIDAQQAEIDEMNGLLAAA
jgi:uncharacterized protein (DUF305 family)